MEKITRRDFLKGSMAGAATMALSGIVTVPAVMAEEEDKYQVKDWKAFMTVNKEMTVFCQEEIPKIGKKIPYFRKGKSLLSEKDNPVLLKRASPLHSALVKWLFAA